MPFKENISINKISTLTAKQLHSCSNLIAFIELNRTTINSSFSSDPMKLVMERINVLG